MKQSHVACGLLALLVTVNAFAAEQTAAPPEPEGMTKLFNGTDLTGWDGDPRLWKVQDGVVRGETTAEVKAKGNTFLILKDRTFGDFDFRIAFRSSATNNSGVQYRSARVEDAKNKDNKWIMKGYQAEIRNEVKFPNVSGFIYDEKGKRGRLVLPGEKAVWEDGKKNVAGQVCTQEDYRKAFKLDGWNEYVILARGNHIQHFINGQQIIDFTDKDPQLALKEGMFALQLHAGAPMWVEFKDARVKELK